LLFFAVMGVVGMVSDALGFPVEDRIAAVFCGSKKTLASGVPMAQLIFGANPGISLILLPIMIYHPLQLIICGGLAGRWAKRNESTADA
jgi:sodium/bile acid cotransporter 7